MEDRIPAIHPPLGGLLDRYLARSFLQSLFVSLACMTVLYLIVDVFDRIDNFLRADHPFSSLLKYFVLKLPLMVSRVFGFAVLFSTLFSLATLSRNHEITAMRSSGISLRRISVPLIALAVLIALLSFLWNETIVPLFTRKAQAVYQVEVKKKKPGSLIAMQEIWIRGDGAFVNADAFNAKKNTLEGVRIYLLDRDFSLRGIVEASQATWKETHWEAQKATEWLFLPQGGVSQRRLTTPLPLLETPEDLQIFSHEPEELSFSDLRKQIRSLAGKGIDTTESQVDLQLKPALSLVAPIMVLLAVPFALRRGLRGGVPASFGLTLIVGLGYWVLLGFSRSLGYTGALAPWAAAWLPNGIFFLTAVYFSLSADAER
jgi:lipopolysaccharide export system permease protein